MTNTTTKPPVFFNELVSFMCLLVNLFFLFGVASQPITLQNVYTGPLVVIMGLFLATIVFFSLLSTGALWLMFRKTNKGDKNRKHAFKLWLLNHAVFLIVLVCTSVYIQRLLAR